MNELLFFISIPFVYLGIILLNKFFGKSGLISWVCLAPIIANILTAKQITLFGIDVTMGTILFSSVFFATDIINELYGKKEANRSVWLSFVSICTYIVVANISLLFKPNSFDFAQEPMKILLGTTLRISIVSAIMFLGANLIDIIIYNAIRKKNKALWLRNNVATMISNSLENFLFIIFAFIGILPFKQIIIMATGTTIVEIILSICDTPFLYMVVKNKIN